MMLYGLQNVFIHHYNTSILMEALGHARYWTDVPGHRALICHESDVRDYVLFPLERICLRACCRT